MKVIFAAIFIITNCLFFCSMPTVYSDDNLRQVAYDESGRSVGANNRPTVVSGPVFLGLKGSPIEIFSAAVHFWERKKETAEPVVFTIDDLRQQSAFLTKVFDSENHAALESCASNGWIKEGDKGHYTLTENGLELVRKIRHKRKLCSLILLQCACEQASKAPAEGSGGAHHALPRLDSQYAEKTGRGYTLIDIAPICEDGPADYLIQGFGLDDNIASFWALTAAVDCTASGWFECANQSANDGKYWITPEGQRMMQLINSGRYGGELPEKAMCQRSPDRLGATAI